MEEQIEQIEETKESNEKKVKKDKSFIISRSMEYVSGMLDVVNRMFNEKKDQTSWQENLERSSIIRSLPILTMSVIMSSPYQPVLKKQILQGICLDLAEGIKILDQSPEVSEEVPDSLTPEVLDSIAPLETSNEV